MTARSLSLFGVPLAEATTSSRADPAWGALIAEHDRKVVLSVLARGARLDEARDLAHEAWARLFEQHLAGKLTRLELPGLAIAQAGFLWAERIRSHSRAPVPLDPPVIGAVADPCASVDSRLERRADLATARAVLESCSPRAREVFSLAYEHPELPHAEIARRVGLSLQRVRQTLCEVRSKVRAALTEPSDG